MKLLLLLLLSSTANAGGWYCKSVASEWVEAGKILRSCGIGKGDDENTARLDAYNNARKEFDVICNKDTTCANKVVNIDPQRSECSEDEDGFTCHRLFNYHITDVERRKEAVVVQQPSVEPTSVEEKVEVHNHSTNVTNYNTNYITVKPVEKEIIRSNNRKGKDSYRTFLRRANGSTIYSTNSREYQGVYLTNPSDEEIEMATKRGGGMKTIYIYDP